MRDCSRGMQVPPMNCVKNTLPVCGDVEADTALVRCECRRYRQHGRPCGYRNELTPVIIQQGWVLLLRERWLYTGVGTMRSFGANNLPLGRVVLFHTAEEAKQFAINNRPDHTDEWKPVYLTEMRSFEQVNSVTLNETTLLP